MKQMDIFDYIEKPKTALENLFGKSHDPVIPCVNCLCSRCANNIEGDIDSDEVTEACFQCDKCQIYTGNQMSRCVIKENCNNFEISNKAAAEIRKKMKMIR